MRLVPHEEVRNVEDCLFMIEQMYCMKNEKFKSNNKYNPVNKTDMFRLKSRKSNSYLAIKYSDPNPDKTDHKPDRSDKPDMILTKNLADLTIFKFEFISHEEKNLVNFFYELNFILDLFIQKDIQLLNEEIDYINRLIHIFKIFEETLKFYKIEKVLFYSEDNNKIDVIINLKEFSIVEKLLKLLFHFWFKSDIKDTYIEKDVLNLKLNEKDKKFTLKKECTDFLLNLLTVIYDIDQSILDSIQSYLNYLFIFVGKIESVTHFLIHILRNNQSLMLKLLSGSDKQRTLNREEIEIKIKPDNFQVKESIKNLFYLKEVIISCILDKRR